MAETKTIYCGGGKKQNAAWSKITVNLSRIPKEHIFEYNGEKFVKLNVNTVDPPKYDKDISLSVDTWKPDSQSQGKSQPTSTEPPF
jgi:hypothetical protein